MSTTLKGISECGSKTGFSVAEIKDVLTVNKSSTENHLYQGCCIRKTVIDFRTKGQSGSLTSPSQHARAACLRPACRGSVLLPARAYLSSRKPLTASLSQAVPKVIRSVCPFLTNVARVKAALLGVCRTRDRNFSHTIDSIPCLAVFLSRFSEIL